MTMTITTTATAYPSDIERRRAGGGANFLAVLLLVVFAQLGPAVPDVVVIAETADQTCNKTTSDLR